MNQLKVSTRLFVLIASLSLLLLVVGGIGLWGMQRTDAALKTVYDDRVVPLAQLSTLRELQQSSLLATLQAVSAGSPQAQAGARATVQNNLSQADGLWAQYMATYLTPDEAALAQRMAALRQRFRDEGLLPTLAVVVPAEGVAAEAPRRLVDSALLPLNAELGAVNADLMQLQVDVAAAAYAAAGARYEQVRWFALLSVASGLLFAVVFGTVLARGLVRQLGAEPREAAAVAQAVAAGELGVHIRLQPGDRSSLMASLLTMRDSLRQTVTGVRQRADGVATASGEIAQGNLDLSQRTEEQASALQQTAASMEQLTSTVRHNADNARQASALAQGATAVATRGGQVVGRVVENMRGIEGSSRRIGDIIGTIDGIAFQTNILALNAAVEAARAGEQGRGFAVVAAEVRTLAQRTAEAAREVKQLITDSVQRVQTGTALVDEAGQTMGEVVAQVQRVTDLVAEISAASAEQSQGVAQIGEAVAQMDQVTQQNAALVEEGSAAAESLKEQAAQLLQAVAVFRLTDAEEAHARGVPAAAAPVLAKATPVAPAAAQAPAHLARQVLARAQNSAAAQASRGVAGQPAAKRFPAQQAAAAPAEAGAEADWQSF